MDYEWNCRTKTQFFSYRVDLPGTPTTYIIEWQDSDGVNQKNTYGASSGSQRFNGKIANASIYNKALTIEEIRRNYNALKSRFGL